MLSTPNLEQNEKSPVSMPLRNILIALFLLGCAIRFAGVLQPIDLPSWRECDIATIARNYVHEGMNLFYPRIDWRGNGPGFAEMEFPLYPWLVALLYKAFGIHEVFAREVSYIFSLVSLGIFARLVYRYLPPAGAIAALIFFILNPLVNSIGHSIQPEGLMFAAYLGGIYWFLRWNETESKTAWWACLFCTTLALLAKASAANIELFFVLLIFFQRRRVLFSPRFLLLIGSSTGVAALWYLHAHSFWLQYGNSLGVSNEHHLANMDLITRPAQLLRLLAIEIWFVWIVPGLAVAYWGLRNPRTSTTVRFTLLWLASIFLYYLAAEHTLAALWASYYHVVSVPVAAILFGCGVDMMVRKIRNGGLAIVGSLLAGVALLALWLANELKIPDVGNLTSLVIGSPISITAGILCVLGCLALTSLLLKLPGHSRTEESGREPEAPSRLGPALAALVMVTFCTASFLSWGRLHDRTGHELYISAKQAIPVITPGTLILASGGPCISAFGYPAAYNASYMFYWTGHKGFNVCTQEQSIGRIQQFSSLGATYFLAEQESMDEAPGFERQLDARYPVLWKSPDLTVFKIR